MPEYEKPTVAYDYEVEAQVNALRKWRDAEPGRQVPVKANNRLLLVTWNIANLGTQDRRDKDHRLIAEILTWFDLIALQEVKDDLRGLRGVHAHLPSNFRVVFSDALGNEVRFAFISVLRQCQTSLSGERAFGSSSEAPANLRAGRGAARDARARQRRSLVDRHARPRRASLRPHGTPPAHLPGSARSLRPLGTNGRAGNRLGR